MKRDCCSHLWCPNNLARLWDRLDNSIWKTGEWPLPLTHQSLFISLSQKGNILLSCSHGNFAYEFRKLHFLVLSLPVPSPLSRGELIIAHLYGHSDDFAKQRRVYVVRFVGARVRLCTYSQDSHILRLAEFLSNHNGVEASS